ncbi:MAG: redox-regulated ATPase YchF [Desulfurococcales archaeon]|nr:redox-regulated ATPase YchF [Desulfurococcales archaeon]
MVNYALPLVGIVGKTNVGKSTFFSAATEVDVDISNRPFTTINPNNGIAYVRDKCPHVEFGLQGCNPRTGFCKNGTRFIPIELMDVAGLIPGAHMGRGLGNKFMDDLRKADVFLLVVDASGSTSPEGVPVKPGTFDPVEEVKNILREIDLWFLRIVSSNWDKLAVSVDTSGKDPVDALTDKLSGIQVSRANIMKTLEETGLSRKKLSSWTKEELEMFAFTLRRNSKPLVIVANKADIPASLDNIKRLREEFKDTPVIPASAEAELALKKAAKAGIIEYMPGDSSFAIKKPEKLSDAQRKALRYIEEKVMQKYGSTGVQQAIETAVYQVLGRVPVYTVEDPVRLTDKKGNVLPDVFLVDRRATIRDVAYLIHSDFARNLVGAINAKTKLRISGDSPVQHGLVVKFIVA